jgi:hypothetical protein
MTPWQEWENAGVVAGVHRAASARPPRATSSFTPRFASSQLPLPISPSIAPRTTGTRQESLGCRGLPPAPPKQQWVRRKTSSVWETRNDS